MPYSFHEWDLKKKILGSQYFLWCLLIKLNKVGAISITNNSKYTIKALKFNFKIYHKVYGEWKYRKESCIPGEVIQ